MDGKSVSVTIAVVLLGSSAAWQLYRLSELKLAIEAANNAINAKTQEYQVKIDALKREKTWLTAAAGAAQFQKIVSQIEPDNQVKIPRVNSGTNTPVSKKIETTKPVGEISHKLSPLVAKRLHESVYTTKYRGYIDSLKLPPDQEALLKERLFESIEKNEALGEKYRNGEISKEDLQSGISALDPYKSVFPDFLTDSQLQGLRDYDSGFISRAQEQRKSQSIADMVQFAPGLTGTNRAVVAQAMESSRYQNQINAVTSGNPDYRSQEKIMGDVVHELAGKLDEEQLKIATDYLVQKVNMDKARPRH